MPLHVKILPEEATNDCAYCGGTPAISLHVFAGGGSDVLEPICMSCLRSGKELTASIELPDASPGRRPPTRRIKRRVAKEERELAALTGGRRQKGSGSLPWAKGDLYRKGVYRGEQKTCFGKRPNWTLDELTKIRGEAAFGEVPFLVTTFMDKATQEVRERWVTIPFEDWKEKYAPGDNP